MTVIIEIILRNFEPFRGEHRLVLGAHAYGVTARHAADSLRSNSLGKSSLLRAIRFALFGVHPHRYEDDWISRGERDGSVTVTLDSGMKIERARRRGKSTRLSVWPGEAVQDEAQALIEREVGFGDLDSAASWWLGQKQIHRFVTGEPSERARIVSAWIGLERLERCRVSCATEATEAEELARRAEIRLATLRELEAQLGADDEEIAAAEEQTKLATVEVERCEALEAADRARADVERLRDEVERVTIEGIAARRIADELPDRERLLREAADRQVDTNAALQIAEQKMSGKAVLARGEFDGRCPIGDCECPIAGELNARQQQNLRLLADAERERDALAQAASAARSVANERRALAREAWVAMDKLDPLRSRLAELRAQLRQLGPEPSTTAKRFAVVDLDRARDERRRADATLERLRRDRQQRRAYEAERGELEEKLAAVRAHLDTCYAGAAVFRRAQRSMAESALARVQDEANAILDDAGVDLSLAVSWAREGKALADACEGCGRPFPSSRKVKACERCGAERGPKFEERLDLELSRRSGGMDDLGGAAFQLAAWGWLREQRGSSWATVLVDEPYGSLDARARQGIGARLAAMIARQGGRQSLVVSHQSDTLAALPGKIEIVSNGQWVERVEVS